MHELNSVDNDPLVMALIINIHRVREKTAP